MKAIRYEKDAVLIQSGKIKAWVDVWIEKEDLRYDWNKFIFYVNCEEDTILRKWQDKVENFEGAMDLAVETLRILGIIYLDENDKWHTTEKYRATKGSIPIIE